MQSLSGSESREKRDKSVCFQSARQSASCGFRRSPPLFKTDGSGGHRDRDVLLIALLPCCGWKWDPEIMTSRFYFQLRSAAEEYATLKRCDMAHWVWPCTRCVLCTQTLACGYPGTGNCYNAAARCVCVCVCWWPWGEEHKCTVLKFTLLQHVLNLRSYDFGGKVGKVVIFLRSYCKTEPLQYLKLVLLIIYALSCCVCTPASEADTHGHNDINMQ